MFGENSMCASVMLHNYIAQEYKGQKLTIMYIDFFLY